MSQSKNIKTDVSMRTAIPKPPDVINYKDDNKFNGRSKIDELKDTIDAIFRLLITVIMFLIRLANQIFECASDIIIKIWRILLFCYRKPKHAKELLVTTIHLIKVSYDAEIWSWSDIFSVIKSHLITPMTKGPISEKKKK